MKKKILLITILLLVVVLALALVACNSTKGEIGGGLWQGKPSGGGNVDNPPVVTPPKPETPEELNAPTGLEVSLTGLASWNKVSGAETYEIQVNSTLITGRRLTSYSVIDMENRPENGVFTIKVRSVRGEEKSEWSDEVTYTHVGSPMVHPVLEYDNGKVVWSSNSNAKNVSIKVNGKENLVQGNVSEYDLSSLNADATITVKFVGDGVYVLDSKEVSVNYKHSTSKIYLPAPQNVKMEGSTLSFDEVLGANAYYLQDVNNTVTVINTNVSDRTNKFLIKAVWASNTDIAIENSEATNVVYFDSSKGAGTESNPFMISSPEEMRFIEYYESTNQSMYYKLANDIVLEEYSPKDDEDISNFYNLGTLSGVIDGNGHSIKNLVVYYKDGYSSIFDTIAKSGIIKNLVIENAKWRTWTNRTNDGVFHEKGGECSILAYTNRGLIDNVTVKTSSITAVKDGASALVSINKGEIKNCTVEDTTTVFGANEAGGIAIFNSGLITRCINKAEIGGNTVIGGIVGRNNGIVTECGNEGKVVANTYAGGIVGYNFNLFDETLKFASKISYCYNTGLIDVTSYGGGIAGKNGGDGINEVGKESYANAGIFSCYNHGTIKGANSLGGIVGDNYGYHEKTTDLGVVGCYSSGNIDINVGALESTRVYLSLENCSWGADAGALMYLHFWSPTESSNWPGIRMLQTTIGGKSYYYADVAVKAEELEGIIFNRLNPTTGDIWNQTEDIKIKFVSGNLCFKVTSDWTTATASSSKKLVEDSPLSAGGIAGFSNMINDCYYKSMTIGGKTLTASVSSGTQYGKVVIGGKETTSSACVINNATLLATLNAVENVWVNGDNGPILKWQKN